MLRRFNGGVEVGLLLAAFVNVKRRDWLLICLTSVLESDLGFGIGGVKIGDRLELLEEELELLELLEGGIIIFVGTRGGRDGTCDGCSNCRDWFTGDCCMLLESSFSSVLDLGFIAIRLYKNKGRQCIYLGLRKS